MNFIDIIIIVPLIYAAWRGFKKGLVIEIFTLLALLVGIYAGIHFSDWTSDLIIQNFKIEGRYLPVVAFTLTFLAVGAMVFFAGKVIERMLKLVSLSLLNKLLGLFLGIVKMTYILSILIVLLETYDERGNFINKELKEESLLYYPVEAVATYTIPAVKQSSIWLENNISQVFDKENEDNLNLEDLKELKHKADSLGITLEDLKSLLEEEE